MILILMAILFGSFSSSCNAASTPAPLREKIKQNYTSIELKGGVKIDKDRQVVTLNLRDSDLRQVIRMLAEKVGKNIIIHDSVDGAISLDLIDVELNKAIEYIMTMKELSYIEDGNTLIVASKSSIDSLGINREEIRGIKIKYIDASRIANFLNKNIFNLNRPGTSSSAIVTTNPSTNEILIFGNKEDIALAQEVVDYLDIKPEMKNFTVKYTDAIAVASKICWTAFKSGSGQQSFTREPDLSEGSEISIVCGTTDDAEETPSGEFENFSTPSYWVLADTGLNQVTIYGGTQEQLALAQEVIDRYDVREPQVYMEISIIELSETGSKDIAQQLSLTSETGTASFSSDSDGVTSAIFPKFRVFGPGTDPLFNIRNSTLSSTIQTTITEGKGRLLANPRIIAANNTTSNIDIKSSFVGPVTTTFNDQGIPTTTSGSQVELGITFKITPKITPSGYVYLSIDPEYDSPKSGGTDESGQLSDTRSLTIKNVRVKDGNTLVLAGLMQENETTAHSKFPFLSDIPIIGVFFQNQSTTKSRSELILMITPRIIYDPDQVVEAI